MNLFIKAKDLSFQKNYQQKPLPSWDPASLGFGLNSTDHMLTIDSSTSKKWGKPEIRSFRPIPIHPFNSSIHYAVQCFEGMKAYKDLSGTIRLFRP